jgi:hypothetical protein
MLIFSHHVCAVVVEDLYTVELPVADQTTTMRLNLFNEAFKQVIIKVSGSEETLSHEGFKRPLDSSARYVHQFRYIVRKDEKANAFDAGQLFLRVVFDEDLVEKLMRENNISVWGKERPSTLLLISFEVNKNATLVSSDTTTELVEEIDSQARRQGLPVLFPLLDLEDRMILGINDVINVNESNIDSLAARYAPDAILTGQVIGRVGKGWKGNWQARFSNRIFSWEHQASSRQEVLYQAIAQLAKTLASEYALQSYQAFDQSVLFSVDQVAAITDHITVQAYLQSLDAVESARLVLISDNKVTYRIKLRNTADDLHRLIMLGYVLEQLDLPQINAATDDQTVIMNYRLIR